MRGMVRKRKNTKLLLGFFLIVTVLVSISISIRVYRVFTEISFNGKDQFTIAILQANDANVLLVTPSKKTALLHSDEPIGQKIEAMLPIPIDGKVVVPGDISETDDIGILWQIMWNREKGLVGITQLDLFRLFVSVLTIDKDKRIVASVDFPKIANNETIAKLLIDERIVEENLTVAIENATGRGGVAARVSVLIESLGGSVVSLTNSRKQQMRTEILVNSKTSYTSKKLEEILGVEATVGKTGPYDILVRIGESSLDLPIFAILEE